MANAVTLDKEKKVKRSSVLRFCKFIKNNIGLIYTTLGGLGSNVLGAFFWLLIASMLNVDDYGLANYFLAIANVAAGVGIVGLNLTLITYLAKGEKRLLYEANSFTLISGIASAVVLSAFHWVAGVVAATTIFFNMSLSESLGSKKYKEYAILSIGQSIAQIILSLLLFQIIGLIGILLGYFLASLVFSYKYLYSISQNFTYRFDILKEKRTFALHSYGYNLIGKRLANYFDKVIIGALFGYYALGLYQLGFQFFIFLTLIPTSLSQYLLPEESSGTNKKEVKIIGLSFSVVVAIAAYITTPFLIQKIFPSFIESVQLIQVMSLAVIPSTIVGILTASCLGKEKSSTVFYAGLIYLISLITGLITLKYVMGEIGLAFAIVVAQTIQAMYLILNNKEIF